MKKEMIPVFIHVFLLFILTGVCIAGEPVFQNSRDEMVKELTRNPVKYRSFVPDARKRSIVVIEKSAAANLTGSMTVVGNTQTGAVDGSNPDQYEKKTISVVDNQDVPGLKLKIEFDYNSSALRPDSFPLLRELGMALNSDQLKTADLLVAGHTDSDGTDEYNLILSIERAGAVKQYLVNNFSIPEARLRIRGYGEYMPLKPNNTSENKQMNRRVEVQLRN